MYSTLIVEKSEKVHSRCLSFFFNLMKSLSLYMEVFLVSFGCK